MNSFLQGIGALVLLMGWMVFSPIWWGLALRVLWGWFVAPVFDVPTLSIAQAIGIQYVIGFVTYHYSGKDERETVEKAAVAVGTPLVFLAVGYIVHLFV